MDRIKPLYSQLVELAAPYCVPAAEDAGSNRDPSCFSPSISPLKIKKHIVSAVFLQAVRVCRALRAARYLRTPPGATQQ